MKCQICRKSHKDAQHPHYMLMSELNDSGFPVDTPEYLKAHHEANKAEKEQYPKGYEKMKSVDAKLSKHELAGKNLKSGKIEVSAKVPKKLRAEVALHEEVESKALRKKK